MGEAHEALTMVEEAAKAEWDKLYMERAHLLDWVTC
jgi:hypothetical protein